MATSITASNPNAPFNRPLVPDANLFGTGSLGIATAASTASISPTLNFKNPTPWPTPAKGVIYAWAGPYTNTANSAVVTYQLQHSTDNATWVNIPQFAPFTTTDNGSAASTGNGLQYTPTDDMNQYVRLAAYVISGSTTAGGATGSFGAQWLV